MKKTATKRSASIATDQESLMRGKRLSTKAKLDWLQSALYFGKLKRFK